MRSALADIPEIKDVKTDPSPDGGTCSFKVAKDFDYKSKFDQLVEEGDDHFTDWEQVN